MPYTTCVSNQMSLPAESMGPVHLAWPGSAAQGKPRRRQARQAVALRQPGKTRKVSPGFEKYCSIKVLFKTYTNSHKHPGIRLLSSESKAQLVNQRKQKETFNQEPRTPQ